MQSSSNLQHLGQESSSPLFSVVSIAYNDYKNLLITYKSVIDQTCKDYEWLVVDGGSKDETPAFLSQLTMNQFSYVSEKDRGLFDAMNKGIGMAKGKYIIFMNAGDCFASPDILQRVSSEIEKNKSKSYDFIYGDADEVNEEGRLFFRKARPFWRLVLGMHTHHQAMFYKTSIILENNILYDLKYNVAADYDFTVRFVKRSKDILYMPIEICIFLQGGLSHQKWKLALAQMQDSRKKYYKLSIFSLCVIYVLQYILQTIRFNFAPLYTAYRFKKK
ncbi:MAG TPA: glycosyltransferase family 2 protein [Chitinophagaceae bacterium]|nr:glycosyltransferase family 2 protein [Chitinophagaceae bacterium]